jgi:type II secretory pathway pseudopilin PulG
MISVAVIGMMAAAVAPALSEMMADNRQSSAANTILRLGRRLRAEAIATGAPQLLRYVQASSNNLGVIEVYAGVGSSCERTPWAQAFAAVDGDLRRPYDVLDMAGFNPGIAGATPRASDRGRHVIPVRAQLPVGTAVNGLQICVQRNGETFALASPVAGALAPQNGTALLSVLRSINTVPRGVVRQIAFPAGGSPRWR